MSKASLLKQLFLAHTTDLVDVMSDLSPNLVPNVKNRVLCPICLVGYTEEAINNNALTDGHIWPKDIRNTSEYKKIGAQRVLLCKKCNSQAGGHGDAQMGILEKVKQGKKSGNLFGIRSVEVFFEQNTEPIKLNTSVKQVKPTEISIGFKHRRGSDKWERNSPDEQNRFLSAISENKRVTVLIRPHHKLKPHLAEIGWITSAYLFAFRAFGYRYILHKSLNSVRQYILNSFNPNNNPQLPKTDILDIYTCDDCYEDTPRLSVVIPFKKDTSICLFVSLLDYHVRLPFHCNPQRFNELLQYRPRNQEFSHDTLSDLGNESHIGVTCTKTSIHSCVWDFVLGKPIRDIN